MISLFYRELSKKLNQFHPYKTVITALKEGNFPLAIRGVQGSFLSIIVKKIYEASQKPHILVLPTDQEAELVKSDLDRLEIQSMVLPWSGTSPYKEIPIHDPIFGKRFAVLEYLKNHNKPLVICSVRSLLMPFAHPDRYEGLSIALHQGKIIDPLDIAKKLILMGYLRVNKVSVAGEFALRGEVLDIYRVGDDSASRITFDFDEIESIKSFDALTQASIKKVEKISIWPAREVLWSLEDRTKLEEAFSSLGEFKQYETAKPGEKEQFLQQLEANPLLEGSEIFFPLVFNELKSLIDFAPDDCVVLLAEYERLYTAAEGLEKEYMNLYRKLRHERIIPRPERILLSLAEIENSIKSGVRLALLQQSTISDDKESIEQSLIERDDGRRQRFPLEDGTEAKAAVLESHFRSEAARSFFGNVQYFKEELQNYIEAGFSIWIFSDSDQQKLRLEHLIHIDTVQIIADTIYSGFTIPDLQIIAIHEREIFGRKRKRPQSIRQVKSEVIDTFTELNEGDHVVHINHGIGRFKGIERIKAAGSERDYIRLEYASREFLFVPIEQVNLIQRYIGSQGSEPRLDTIGGKSWDSRKGKVRKSVEDLAEHLLKLYSKRKKSSGFAFPPDTEWQIQFETQFPFEETEDQITCIQEVKEDMERPNPMDRLVCGDVGYGKTEIALRAAFKAVSAGKQAAILAPTTILVEQHYETLEERLNDFPVNVGMLSRFVSKKQQREALEKLEQGELDLVVGTHRLLQKDVKFKDLGLMVIDEEQRFGVKAKERLKELKHSVDSLTLTATPIPRTLHMSLLKIRDMSVLKTAPMNRRPIETFVEPFNEEKVADAIRREVARGGQVFYLHNRVETLENVQRFIQNLVPEVMVEIAHGKMGPSELEDIMHRFIHGGFQVMVATTIIENGINIPNVNTIIIDRADMYGISQLYQLRGRVGRAGRLAYAYLLYPGERVLSELAMKRLQIISDHTELGSGFKIAMKDLEVRGAGNLLGAQQSGDIYSVGFEMYLKLLDEAVRRLDQSEEEQFETYLELEYSGFIPQEYIPDSMEKMEVYKKIASINDQKSLEALTAEIEDRFGPIPDEVASLLALADIRVLCNDLKIASLRERKGKIEIMFAKLAHISVDKVMNLIQLAKNTISLDPKRPNVLIMDTSQIGLQEKSEFLRQRLSSLMV